MTIDREELAAIKKRNAATYRFKQNLTEAEADRSALLDALDEIRRALGTYALVPPDGGAEPTSDLVRNLVTRVAELEEEVSRRREWMAVQAPLNDDCARLIKRLHSRVAELEKTLAEASEEADVRDGEGDTLVGQIKMYIQHRHDLALQNITLRKRVAELEAHRDCSISFRGFRLSGSAESTAEVRRLLRVEERLAELEAAQEWMPIESAPRDGTPLLLTSAAHGMLILVGWYDSELEAWSLWPGEKAYGARIGATHWLPLPSPPKVAT